MIGAKYRKEKFAWRSTQREREKAERFSSDSIKRENKEQWQISTLKLRFNNPWERIHYRNSAQFICWALVVVREKVVLEHEIIWFQENDALTNSSLKWNSMKSWNWYLAE